MCRLAGWATTTAAADPADLAQMMEALSPRNAEDLCAVIDQQARRSVVLAASFNDEASAISVALDGPLINAAALRAELAK